MNSLFSFFIERLFSGRCFFFLFSLKGLFFAGSELVYASKKGDLEEVKSLIEKGLDIDEKDEDGWTALMVASRNKTFSNS